jgi:hypothetical protein
MPDQRVAAEKQDGVTRRLTCRINPEQSRPGKVRTRRGRHFQYRDTGFDFGKLTSLKKFDINADIKRGNSIVAAPWSRGG